MTKKSTSKASSRPLESFSPELVKLLMFVAANPDKAPVTVPLPDSKRAFRFKMDLYKLRKDLQKADVLEPAVRKQLPGLKFSLAENSSAVIIDHFDADYINPVRDLLNELGADSYEAPDLSELIFDNDVEDAGSEENS
jgi:hypothetical protein